MIINFIKKNLLFIVLLLFFILIYNKWFIFGVLTDWDWSYFVNPAADIFWSYIWRSSFWLWWVFLDFWQWVRHISQIIYNIFGINYEYISKIVFLYPNILFWLIGSYFLWKKLFNNNYSIFLFVIAYCFNTYFLTIQNWHNTLAVSFSLFPIIFLLYLIYLDKRKLYIAIIFVLVGFVSFSYEPRAFLLQLFIVFLYFVFYLFKISKKDNVLKLIFDHIFVLLLFLLLNLRRYFPLSNSLLWNISSNEVFNRSLRWNWLFDIQNSFTLFFWHRWSENEYRDFIKQSPMVIYWIIPLIVIFWYILNYKKNKNVLFFFIISLIWILLSKQSWEPFPYIYQWLYDNMPWFNAFREASKFYFFIVFGYSALIWYFFEYIYNSKYRIFKFVLFIVVGFIFVSNANYLYTGRILWLFVEKKIPNEYILLNNYLKNNSKYWRILYVPKVSRWVYYDKYNVMVSFDEWFDKIKWEKMIYSDRITNTKNIINNWYILNKSSIKIIVLPLLDLENNNDLFKDYWNSMDDPRYNEYISWDALKTLINQRSYNIYNQYYEILKNAQNIEELNIWTNKLKVFEVSNYMWLFNANFDLKYIYANSTQYHLSIKWIKSSQDLSFLQSYHPERKLYPGKAITNCQTTQPYNSYTESGSYHTGINHTVLPWETIYSIAQQYNSGNWRKESDYIYDLNNLSWARLLEWQTLQIRQEIYPEMIQTATGNITECIQSGYKFYEWAELSYLQKEPLRDDSHKIIYDYANARDINIYDNYPGTHETYLAKWLREWWISENTDDTYDVNLVLYFRPQSWFYLWLGISGVTFLWLLIWLVVAYRRDKNSLEIKD